jgi:hypothetical protein
MVRPIAGGAQSCQTSNAPTAAARPSACAAPPSAPSRPPSPSSLPIRRVLPLPTTKPLPHASSALRRSRHHPRRWIHPPTQRRTNVSPSRRHDAGARILVHLDDTSETTVACALGTPVRTHWDRDRRIIRPTFRPMERLGSPAPTHPGPRRFASPHHRQRYPVEPRPHPPVPTGNAFVACGGVVCYVGRGISRRGRGMPRPSTVRSPSLCRSPSSTPIPLQPHPERGTPCSQLVTCLSKARGRAPGLVGDACREHLRPKTSTSSRTSCLSPTYIPGSRRENSHVQTYADILHRLHSFGC